MQQIQRNCFQNILVIIGNNETSFKFLIKDENLKEGRTITKDDIKIIVKGTNPYESAFGQDISIEGEPLLYGPIQEGSRLMRGIYYKIIANNIYGTGNIYLGIKSSLIEDKAGNTLNNGMGYYELATDVKVDCENPVISATTTEIIVKDNGYGLITDKDNYIIIMIDGKSVQIPPSGRIATAQLEEKYEIKIKQGTEIRVIDKCGNIETMLYQ